MSMSCHSFLSVCGLLLVLVAFLLQLVALTSTWWATFSARTDLGKPNENGHYGLWSLCSTKGPHWTEDCDPLDTFFQVPSYLQISGIFGVLHLLIILTFLPLGSLWAVQIFRNMPHLCLKPKSLCIAKVSVAFISVIFAILVAIFASVGENRQTEYFVRKAWAFWLQISVIGADIVLTMVCVLENFKFWQEHIRQHVDPEGIRAETYGNPTFDADSPELSRHRHFSNGTIAYTETSGHPYNPGTTINGSPRRMNPHPSKSGDSGASRQPKKGNTRAVLTYENESYQEHSPSSRRMSRNYNH